MKSNFETIFSMYAENYNSAKYVDYRDSDNQLQEENEHEQEDDPQIEKED